MNLKLNSEEDLSPAHVDRRSILKLSAGAALAGLFSGCTTLTWPMTHGGGPKVNLGSGDTGIMNYALALEGLEAAFYTQVMATPYGGMTAMERDILDDIRKHEVIHREFFEKALGSNAIPSLNYNFSTIDFSNRSSVLLAARTFEDTGVVAYNGAGHLVRDVNVLLIAGKIVSVEARHSAAIRDLIEPLSDAFSPAALDGAHSPAGVLKTVSPYIHEHLDGSSLPRA